MRIDITRNRQGTLVVHCDGFKLSLKPSLRVINHSPTGFEIGYGGSGPAQLALAILLRAGVWKHDAAEFHQAFKWEFLATREAPCSLEVDIDAWVGQQRAARQKTYSGPMEDS